MHMYVCLCMYVYIYIYLKSIHKREREREREKATERESESERESTYLYSAEPLTSSSMSTYTAFSLSNCFVEPFDISVPDLRYCRNSSISWGVRRKGYPTARQQRLGRWIFQYLILILDILVPQVRYFSTSRTSSCSCSSSCRLLKRPLLPPKKKNGVRPQDKIVIF